MNAVHRFFGLFRNSPTFGRDRANLISGFTVGTTALVLNTAILIMVLPLMMYPNDRDFRTLTQNIEFGQLLGLILMGGATVFATMLIPMRLGTVFMGPRIGRYFDQIVLSGITPLRFLIGKVTSQNLFLALALFLLLPWFVLVLALGGLEGPVFLGNLILVWLYCMMLAMVMLWLSLHMNEILAMLMLMIVAAILCGLGCAPFPVQPFVVTPFPALMHSVYTAVGATDIDNTQTYFSAFASCAVGMSVITCFAFAGIYLGPLYGIVRDNSTFGEVVKPGDSKRKRRFRFRLHIQRPSEIAFFYENRGNTFRRHEGLVRWGTTMMCLLLPVVLAWTLFVSSQVSMVPTVIGMNGDSWEQWWAAEFHVFCHVFHGFAMVIAVFLFSHARNTTYLQLPVLFGWKAKVSHLDWIGFVLILFLSTTASIGVPLVFNLVVAAPAGTTVFPDPMYAAYGRNTMDYLRVSIEGTLALSVAAVTVYLLQRTICLYTWLKSAAMMIIAIFYVVCVCIIPMFIGVFSYEVMFRSDQAAFHNISRQIAAMSPFFFFMQLYQETPPIWRNAPSSPFYMIHSCMIVACVVLMWQRSRRLQLDYPNPPVKEVRS